MGYRYNIPLDKNDEPIKPEDTLLRFDVRNGAVMNLALDCRYCTKDIDHPFWLFPRYPGDTAVARRSNGYPYYKWRDVRWPYDNTPINFYSEERTRVEVVFDEEIDPDYIDAFGRIEEDTPSIVRVRIKTNFPSFSDKPIEKRFTVFVSDTEGYNIDAVVHGILVILPGSPFPQGETPDDPEEEQEAEE